MSYRFSTTGRGYTQKYGCPICGKFDFCNYSDSMSEVICMRSAGCPTPPGWMDKGDVNHSLGEGKRYQTIESFEDWKSQNKGYRSPFSHTKEIAKPVERERKEAGRDLDLYDRVYHRMFELLRLEDRHYQHFKNVRQLTDSQIERLGAKSSPSNWAEITSSLSQEFGKAVLSVPGFFKEDGKVKMVFGTVRGFYIPMIRNGKIWSVRFRREEGGPKYAAFSGRGDAGTINNGTIYYPENPFEGKHHVIVTEGEIKAITLCDYYRIPAITTVGNGAWRASGVLEMVKEYLVPQGMVVVAYDMDSDPKTRKDTEQRRTALCQALVDEGFKVKYLEWNGALGKGLDDVLNEHRDAEIREVRFLHQKFDFPVDRIFDESNMVMDDKGVYRVPNFQSPKRYQIMKWQKGRGKSEWVARKLGMGTNGVPNLDRSWMVDEDITLLENPGSRVLSLTHRVLLGAANAKRWGLRFYRSDKNGEVLDAAEIQACKRLSITIDSSRSLGYQNDLPVYDWIIIDEASQVTRHLIGSTLKGKRSDTLNMFISLLRAAKRVTFLDADMSREDYDTIVELVGGPDDIETIVDSGQMPARTPIVRFTGRDGKEGIEAELEESVRKNRKVYVTCDSRKYTQETYRHLTEAFPEKTFLMINSDNSPSDEIIHFLRNINTDQFNYDGIVCSPSVGTGVDIFVPYFQDVYVMCGSNKGITASDVAQQMARVRHPENIYSYICDDEGGEPENMEFWLRWVEENLKELEIRLEWDEQTKARVRSREEVALKNLWARCKSRDARSHNRMNTAFYEQVEEEGHRIIDAVLGEKDYKRKLAANERVLRSYQNQLDALVSEETSNAETEKGWIAKTEAKLAQVEEMRQQLDVNKNMVADKKAIEIRGARERKKVKRARKVVKADMKKERHDGIRGAADLTDDQAKELKQRPGVLKDTERYALTRKRIKRVYGVDVNDTDFQAEHDIDLIDFDAGGRMDRRIANFALINDRTDVAKFMIEEIERFREHNKACFEIVPLNFIHDTLLMVLKKLNLFDGKTWNLERQLKASELVKDGTAQWLADNRLMLSRKLGIAITEEAEKNPIREIGRIVALCGLQLKSTQINDDTRFYKVDEKRLKLLSAILALRDAPNT